MRYFPHTFSVTSVQKRLHKCKNYWDVSEFDKSYNPVYAATFSWTTTRV